MQVRAGFVTVIAALGVLAVAIAHAQESAPALSDIARCNEQAQAALDQRPSASPDTSAPRAPVPPPPVPESRGGIPGAPGARGSTDRPQSGATQSPTLTPAPGTRTDPSGSFVTRAPDPLLHGMAVEGLSDPTYRAAYRDCMAKQSKSPAGR